MQGAMLRVSVKDADCLACKLPVITLEKAIAFNWRQGMLELKAMITKPRRPLNWFVPFSCILYPQILWNQLLKTKIVKSLSVKPSLYQDYNL